MNILQILPELNVGGVETGTVDFAKYLVAHGHASVVVSSGGTLVEDLEKNGSKHYTLPVHKKNIFLMWRAMRQLVDTLRQKMGSGVVVLGTTEDGKVALISGVTKDLTGRLHAGKIIQAVARDVGGTGGGRPDLAEAGGKDTSALKSALDHVPGVVEGML